MKFLIDECLCLALADMAVDMGYYESAHVTRRGMAGRKDPELVRGIIDNDWTFVTRNSRDFRPNLGNPSRRPIYVGLSLHAGLVCLNYPHGTNDGGQKIYFQAVLDRIKNLDDLVNKLVEADPVDDNGTRIGVSIQDFPKDDA